MTNFADYIYDGMRVIQERDGGNTPSVSYTRGNDLSGSMEGAGLPRQSEASAGGIGGLLARSSGYDCVGGVKLYIFLIVDTIQDPAVENHGLD